VLQKFRGKIFSLLCKETTINAAELMDKYKAENKGELPDFPRLGFPNLSALLRACTR